MTSFFYIDLLEIELKPIHEGNPQASIGGTMVIVDHAFTVAIKELEITP